MLNKFKLVQNTVKMTKQKINIFVYSFYFEEFPVFSTDKNH